MSLLAVPVDKGSRSFTVALSDVVEGNYDLKVPRLVVQVTLLTPSSSGDWVVGLQVSNFGVYHSITCLQYVAHLLLSSSTVCYLHVYTQDPTGSINGFVSAKHMSALQEREQSLCVGCTLLLEQVGVDYCAVHSMLARHYCVLHNSLHDSMCIVTNNYLLITHNTYSGHIVLISMFVVSILCCICIHVFQVSILVSAAPVLQRNLCIHPKCMVCVWR